MKIGIIAGGFKPFTSGHMFMVEKAAKENKEVYLFVSITDRIRKNEYPIYWKQMEIIWSQFIAPFLSPKVKVFYSPNPLAALIDHLKIVNNDSNNKDKYTFYADSNDVKHMENDRIKITLSRIITNNQLQTSPVNREKNINVSGTMARQALSENNKTKFITMLPEYQQKLYGELIFNILIGKQ